MIGKREFGAKFCGARVVLGCDAPRLLNPFGYGKEAELDRVYVIDPEASEATDGGCGHTVLAQLHPRGTPQETLQWAEDALSALVAD